MNAIHKTKQPMRTQRFAFKSTFYSQGQIRRLSVAAGREDNVNATAIVAS